MHCTYRSHQSLVIAESEGTLLTFRQHLSILTSLQNSRDLNVMHRKNSAFMDALSNALGDSGILVAQVGTTGRFLNTAPFLEGLEIGGFKSVVGYEGAHGHVDEIRCFLLAMKNWDTRTNWFRNSAEVDLQIHERLLRTQEGSHLPLHFFDGASMVQNWSLSRSVENTWCQKYPHNCKKGHGYDPDLAHVPVSMLEVKPSVIAKGGRGVFTKQFIPKGTVVALDDCVHGMHVRSPTFKVIEDAAVRFGDVSEFWSTVLDGYLEGYGWFENDYVGCCMCLAYRSVCLETHNNLKFRMCRAR